MRTKPAKKPRDMAEDPRGLARPMFNTADRKVKSGGAVGRWI